MSENPDLLLPSSIGDFDVQRIAPFIYRLSPKSPGYIAQTGAAVTTYFKLPIPHYLNSVSIKHVDATDADSTDVLDYTIKKRLLQGKNLYTTMRSGAGVAASDVLEEFGKEYVNPSTDYVIVTDTTNNHRIYVTIDIVVL